MLIIHHTLHNNRKKVLIVRHTPEKCLKNEILSYTRKCDGLSVFSDRPFFCIFRGIFAYHASGNSGGLTPLLDREKKPVISPVTNNE